MPPFTDEKTEAQGLGRDVHRATQLLSSCWAIRSRQASQPQFPRLSHSLGSAGGSVSAVSCAETRGGRESEEATSIPTPCGLVIYPAFLSTASPALKASSQVSATLLHFSSLSMAAPSGPATKDHRLFWNAL